MCWVYDLDHWGLSGQGTDETSALEDLHERAIPAFRRFLGRHRAQFTPLGAEKVVERIHGDERAFELDRQPATDEELQRTLQLLGWARQDLLSLLADSSTAELRWNDPQRVMPSWATWRTAELMMWHVADTESRYYLAMMGVPPPPRATELVAELVQSHDHVVNTLPRLARDRVMQRGDEVWTTRKVLRRLAWHERGEIDAIKGHLTRARRALR